MRSEKEINLEIGRIKEAKKDYGAYSTIQLLFEGKLDALRWVLGPGKKTNKPQSGRKE